MLILILGLIVFLGVHSVRMVAEPFRERFIAERGELVWKLVYSLLSVVGLVLIVVGYRAAPETIVWVPPGWLRHVAFLLTALAFVLVTAAYVPGNRIRAAVRHPMTVGVKVWAFAHLLVNGGLAGMVLFGAFLLWAIFNFSASRRRDRRAGQADQKLDGGLGATAITVVVGLVLWLVFAGWLHLAIIGVSPIVIGGSAT